MLKTMVLVLSRVPLIYFNVHQLSEHSRSEIHIQTLGLGLSWSVSLWYKRAGVATPWSQPIRAQYLSWPMRVLDSVLDEDRWDKAASHKISNWTESEEKLQQRRTSVLWNGGNYPFMNFFNVTNGLVSLQLQDDFVCYGHIHINPMNQPQPQ